MSDADRAPIANAPSGPQPAGLDPAEQPPATPDRRVHLIGNAHLDCVWLWPWQEGYQEARATFWSALHRMDEYPDFVFTCDQIVLLDWVREQDPELFAAIGARVREGRWVNVGGWWVEPDCNLPMGESFVRQGLYGQRFLVEHFGQAATVGMNVDPFGHNVAIPMILRGQGMDAYTFQRPGTHEADLPATPFRWRSPDGSEVLVSRVPGAYCSSGGDLSGQVGGGIGHLPPGQDLAMVFYGVGNHGGGPTRANLDSLARYRRMGSFGELVLSSPPAYFAEVRQRTDLDTLPVITTDLQHHAAGCYSAHSGIKAWQRRAQHAVLTAERWAILVDLLDHDHNPALRYPRERLGQAWRQVLFNQFHDVLPGSAIEAGFDDARDQLGEATAIAQRATALAHNALARQIDIPLEEATQPVVVFNPHPWPLTETVEITYLRLGSDVSVSTLDGDAVAAQSAQPRSADGDPGRGAVAFTAELPALGYRVYALAAGSAATGPGGVSVDGWTMANDHLLVSLDPETGWLCSLLDKQTGLDLVAGAIGPHTQVCEDPTDTWGHYVRSYAWPGAELPVTRVWWRERGPVRARLQVERAWHGSRLVEELVLDAHADAVRVEVTLDWAEQAHVLKLRVPVALEEPEARLEQPFGYVDKPVDAGEEPGQAWLDLTGRLGDTRAGLAVVTYGKHGFDASPADHPRAGDSSSLGFTATRSAVYSWHDPRLLDETASYPFQDQGRQRFRYLLVPHGADWTEADLFRRAMQLGRPVRAQLESFHDGVLPAAAALVSADGVMITAVKGSEDPGPDGEADLVVRAAEVTGRAVRATLDLPVLGHRLATDFTPWQVRTFLVPRDPRRRVRELNLVEWPAEPTAPIEMTRIPTTPRLATGPLTLNRRS